MAGISLDDLLNTMNKAGVPMNTLSPTGQFDTQADKMRAARGQVASGVQRPDVEKYKKEYMNKINKIAEMDTKLAGAYGDPNSKLFIEHAGQRENSIYGARPVMEAQTELPINAYNQEVDQYNNKVKEAEAFYNDLITQQIAGEAEQKKFKGGSLSSGQSLDFDELVASLAEDGTNEEGANFDDLISSLME